MLWKPCLTFILLFKCQMSASGLRLKVCGDFWHSHPTSTSLASHVSWTDLTRLMCGMLRWRSEQAWQTNTPKVSDAQSGSAGETEKGKKGEPGGIREMMKVKEREREKEEMKFVKAGQDRDTERKIQDKQKRRGAKVLLWRCFNKKNSSSRFRL